MPIDPVSRAEENARTSTRRARAGGSVPAKRGEGGGDARRQLQMTSAIDHLYPRRSAVSVSEPGVAGWMERARAEYREMPGLALTKAQMRRMWGIGPEECDELLVALLSVGFLRQTAQNTYVMAGERA